MTNECQHEHEHEHEHDPMDDWMQEDYLKEAVQAYHFADAELMTVATIDHHHHDGVIGGEHREQRERAEWQHAAFLAQGELALKIHAAMGADANRARLIAAMDPKRHIIHES